MTERTDPVDRRGLGAVISTALSLGFRPFYLAAGIFAAISVPLWMAVYGGGLVTDGYLSGAAWHAHEMLFGFAPAVIAGFLLTAARNWTGRPTPTGAALAALVALWVAGRVLVMTGPTSVAPVVDGLFLPALALAVGYPIWRSGNRRNLFVIAVLAALALANLLFHLGETGLAAPGMAGHAIRIALDMMAILMAVMGGRIIPAFTGNALPSAKPRRLAIVEVAAIGLLLLVLAVDLLAIQWPNDGVWLAAILAVAAGIHVVRLALWSPLATRTEPLLWCLPLSYAWIPVALALRAAALIWVDVSPIPGQHALVIGAMAGLMLAMMTRSALGHTGRPLTAGWAEASIFVLVQAAALLRVIPDLVLPTAPLVLLYLSSICWTAAFMILVVRYTPILTGPRIDGRTG